MATTYAILGLSGIALIAIASVVGIAVKLWREGDMS
jgi:HAMP domain-containing protein